MEQTGLFNIDTVKTDVEKIKENIKAPYVNAYHSTLGGEKNISVLITVSLDEKETWANRILENSRYFKIHVTNNGEMTMFAKNYKINEKLRKTKVKSVDDIINKINTYINSVNNITEEDLNEDCWDGYEQIGMKKKGKKEVPNCVPITENEDNYEKMLWKTDERGFEPQAIIDEREEPDYFSKEWENAEFLWRVTYGFNVEDDTLPKYTVSWFRTQKDKFKNTEIIDKSEDITWENGDLKGDIMALADDKWLYFDSLKEAREKAWEIFNNLENMKNEVTYKEKKRVVENYIKSLVSKEIKLIKEEKTDKMFTVKVKHDKGTKTIKTNGSNEEDVIKKIMKAEGCPKNAIVSVKEI